VTEARLTKRQKRILRQNGEHELLSNKPTFNSPNFNLKRVHPLTDNQKKTFDAFRSGKHLMLHGMAGTGKTFLSMYLAIDDLMSGTSEQEKIYIVRSVVPTRDMGFLPGSQKEKMKVYEAPYYAICNELFERGDAYDILKQKNAVEFMSTSFVRGTTLNNCYVIVDEINNMTFHELDSVITRIGKNCRVIFCGDFRQSDLTREQERNGLKEFMKVIDRLSDFEYIDFLEADIVRSKLVKEYIIARQKLGLQP
jgi:phosphate starvation-inducible PhoH-like protein